MLTRNKGKFTTGYYKNLDKCIDYCCKNNILGKENKCIRTIKNSLKMSNLIKSINFNILSKLYRSRKTSPIISFKITIDENICNFLKQNYNFTSKFNECDSFINDFKIKTIRCRNIKFYCIAQNINFKIVKGKSLKYFDFNQSKCDICSNVAYSHPSLSIRFLKICKP